MDDMEVRIAKARETMSTEQCAVLHNELFFGSADSICCLLAYEEERQRMIADIPKHFDDGRRQAHSEIAEAHKKEIVELTGMRDQRDRAIRERDRARDALRMCQTTFFTIVAKETGKPWCPQWIEDALADEDVSR